MTTKKSSIPISKTIEYSLFMSAKYRAKKYKREFNITYEDINLEFCPVFDIKHKRTFKNSKRKPLDNSPALDRIDSSKGYVIEI